MLNELNAGCSAFSWETKDGKHLWGRNFDFNRIAAGSQITFLPRNVDYYRLGTYIEQNLNEKDHVHGTYAAIGTGATVLQSTPTLFEGINEKGLMGGQLYFRQFASYAKEPKAGTCGIQPAFLVTELLTQCSCVEDIIEHLETKITIIDQKIFGSVPTVHWIFSDASGQTILIESEADGLHIYKNSMGILTNSPNYRWHETNLLNYGNIGTKDHDTWELNHVPMHPCFSGTGGLGLPGDCSSPSRFVRLAYLKAHGEKGANEPQGVTYMFRLFENIAFPLGMVSVGQDHTVTEHDANVTEFDYTLYTSVMCAESLKFYWNLYDQMQIQCIDLHNLLDETTIRQFPMESGCGINYI